MLFLDNEHSRFDSCLSGERPDVSTERELAATVERHERFQTYSVGDIKRGARPYG